jgi:hypothetical protein
MHVAHFHPPRAVIAAVTAAVLAIVVTLAIATRLNDVSAGAAPSAVRATAVSRLAPTPAWAGRSTARPIGAAPASLRSPFAPLIGSRLTSVWPVARGG